MLRGFPDFLPGTVSTIAGPAGMPSFWTAIRNMFNGFTQRGARSSNMPCLLSIGEWIAMRGHPFGEGLGGTADRPILWATG
ncbi:hypothetical protein [Micromonospora sicca]|uniref:hypothetical protein n=1 Tax=Micromonospora sicca TaxID=2202420 RepID=UPI001F2BCCCA|nr:hypothetical protein [Micromonospora sp. 4G51]